MNEIPVLKKGLTQVEKQLFGHQFEFDEVARVFDFSLYELWFASSHKRLVSSTLFHNYFTGGSHVETSSEIETNGGGEERESDGSYDRQGGSKD